MKLFSKSKPGAPRAAGASPNFQPIDRVNLLALLDRIVNQGEACVVHLREPRGVWTYAFQGGGLIHAGGGAVKGARQAFDLLWEFQQGEVSLHQGTDPSLSSNLYIDKARLLDMIRRSQGAPGSPYMPPGQAPVNQPSPQPGQRPGTPLPGWNPGPYPPGYPAAAPPGWTPPRPAYPAAPPQPFPPGYPAQYPYPGQPGAQPPRPPQPQHPWPGYPAQAPQGPPAQAYPAQPIAPPQAPMPAPPMARPPAPPRPPQSFSVPPMPLPKPRGTVSLPSRPGPPQAAPPPPPAPAPGSPAGPATPVDELKTLRATLVSQAPAVPVAAVPPGWNVRGPGGAVAPPPAQVKGKGTKGARAPKRPGKLRSWARVKLITFLLWACERRYSPDDHWTVKDAFEVATLELRDQFLGAFTQSFQSAKPQKGATDEFEGDQIASGRKRGRTRGRRR